MSKEPAPIPKFQTDATSKRSCCRAICLRYLPDFVNQVQIYIFFFGSSDIDELLTPLMITLLSIINFARLVPIGALLRARESQQCGTMLQM